MAMTVPPTLPATVTLDGQEYPVFSVVKIDELADHLETTWRESVPGPGPSDFHRDGRWWPVVFVRRVYGQRQATKGVGR